MHEVSSILQYKPPALDPGKVKMAKFDPRGELTLIPGGDPSSPSPQSLPVLG